MKEDQSYLTLGSNDPKFIIQGGYSNMNNEELYQDLKSYFRKYLDTNETEIGLLVLYASATHMYDRYPISPILHISGDFETGKNRRLDLIRSICFKPTFYSNPTFASLFRTTEANKGTILLDEADAILGSPEIKNFLLAGYQKGVTIPRMVADNTHLKGYRTEEFVIFGPKVIVTREGCDDEALNSRSITIITLPKSADSSVPDTLPEEAFEEGKELKKRVELVISNKEEIRSSDINLGLKNRAAQLFECIKDVAQIFGLSAINDLQDFIVNDYLPGSKYDTLMTIQQELIMALDDCWIKSNRAYLKTLASKLGNDSSDYHNISPKRIARVLRSLGFKTDERDNKGQYASPNSELMILLKAKYQIEDNSSESGVAGVVKSDRVRPKRVTTTLTAYTSSKKPRRNK
ncbi:MAG: hypothetical protein IH964_03035 [Candidatus Dadabacteria bacterium]|nr:hypothetical protein [Candidatus Dadabacteria bacterium]